MSLCTTGLLLLLVVVVVFTVWSLYPGVQFMGALQVAGSVF